jgi:desampylase
MIDAAALAALVGAHRASGARELVGLLAGRRGAPARHIARFEPVANAAAAADRFAVDPRVFLAACARLERAGLTWIGFAHGHPAGAAVPSAIDRRELWRDCVQLVAGTVAGGVEVRAWAWRGGDFREVPLRVAAAAAAAAAP